MNIILIIEGVLFVYEVYSAAKIILDYGSQKKKYMNQGYPEYEAQNMALQDIGPALMTQVTMFPESPFILIKIGEVVAKEVIAEVTKVILRAGKSNYTVFEVEKRVYAEIKDVLKDFSNVKVVDKITIPDQVQKVIDNYKGQTTNTPSSSPSQPVERILPDIEPVAREKVQDFPRINSPEAQTSTRPVLKGSVDKTVIQDDAKAKLDDFLQKGQQLRDSIEEHNKLTPEELGKQIADPSSAPVKTKITQDHVNQASELVKNIYNPQNQAEQQEMINDVQKIEGLKNITEQEIKRVVSQKGAEILEQNAASKAQGLPTKDLKDIYKESIDELVNINNSIETGKQIAKSILPPDGGITPSYPPQLNPNPNQTSADSDVVKGTLNTNETFTNLADRIMGWVKEQLKEKAKEKAQEVVLEVIGKIMNKNPSPSPTPTPTPSPTPAPTPSPSLGISSGGGGDVHVKGHIRDGHTVKPYDRSRPG